MICLLTSLSCLLHHQALLCFAFLLYFSREPMLMLAMWSAPRSPSPSGWSWWPSSPGYTAAQHLKPQNWASSARLPQTTALPNFSFAEIAWMSPLSPAIAWHMPNAAPKTPPDTPYVLNNLRIASRAPDKPVHRPSLLPILSNSEQSTRLGTALQPPFGLLAHRFGLSSDTNNIMKHL